MCIPVATFGTLLQLDGDTITFGLCPKQSTHDCLRCSLPLSRTWTSFLTHNVYHYQKVRLVLTFRWIRLSLLCSLSHFIHRTCPWETSSLRLAAFTSVCHKEWFTPSNRLILQLQICRLRSQSRRFRILWVSQFAGRKRDWAGVCMRRPEFS